MLKKTNQKLTSLVRNLPRFDWRIQKRLKPIFSRENGILAAVLARPKDFHDAVWCAYSAHTFVPQIKQIQFMFDGDLTPKRVNQLKAVFPDAKLSNAQKFASDFQRKHRCCSSVAKRLLAKKLFSILELSHRESLLYLDSDVFLFQTAEELYRAIAKNSGMIMNDRGTWNQDNELLQRARLLGLPSFNNANSGLMYIPRNGFSTKAFTRLYESPLQTDSRFFEQTTFGILAAASQFSQLSAREYVVDAQGMKIWESDIDYTDVVCRHFTGIVRHRIRMQGVPILISRLDEKCCFER